MFAEQQSQGVHGPVDLDADFRHGRFGRGQDLLGLGDIEIRGQTVLESCPCQLDDLPLGFDVAKRRFIARLGRPQGDV